MHAGLSEEGRRSSHHAARSLHTAVKGAGGLKVMLSQGEATAAKSVRSKRRLPAAPAGLSGQGVTWPGVASLRPQPGWPEGHDNVTGAGSGAAWPWGWEDPPARLWMELVGIKGGAMGAGAHARHGPSLSGLAAGR